MEFRGTVLGGLVAACALLTLGAATPAAAQSARPAAAASRSGFFIGGGLGAGSAGASCDGCTSDRSTGLSGYFHLGGTVNPHLRLGFETNGWVKSESGINEQLGFASGVAYVYPSVSNNLWLKGGMGYAHYKASDDVDELTTGGLGLSVGVGYDWMPSRSNFAVIPYVNYLHQASGNAAVNGADTGLSAHANLLQFGVGLGYRH
jgi:hypothetical protein